MCDAIYKSFQIFGSKKITKLKLNKDKYAVIPENKTFWSKLKNMIILFAKKYLFFCEKIVKKHF